MTGERGHECVPVHIVSGHALGDPQPAAAKGELRESFD